MEKTAIQWLLEQYIQDGHISIENASKAKEIEKQQIITAFHEGIENTWKYFDNEMNHSGEIYYKQTFGGSND